MGLLNRKSGSATKSEPEAETATAQSLPVSRTFGHRGAIDFADTVAGQRWVDAEAMFQAASLVDQAHMVNVASSLKASPESFADWVQQDVGSGVAELVWGATEIVKAWEVRSGAAINVLDSSVIDNFHETLQGAEEHLFAATDKMPDSSLPWQHLLTSGRGLHVNRFELDNRYVRHIERGELLGGHMSFQQLITKKWAGSHEEMWEHAEWILNTAPAGAPQLAVVPVALIENHIKAELKYESIRDLPELIGKSEMLEAAVQRSYLDPAFDGSTPDGATALSAWFTFHYVMGDWERASELVPLIGERFAKFPMMYFQDTSWEELRDYVGRRLASFV